ncbi:MAG: peptide deformylase [Flavobacteriaceae bacterium]|jgi:peptide deformylase|nr:peptide deformylase [Flavobacteriaceae bacterium]MDP4673921.1 peptide deformylase [Flavobacteriaceae bacterium]MDP4754707.1 peptide deformylase [Flavobacteriaceae bacterium]MDP4794548.1 peptide deformylase [Flavobacteriaceae bacterium]MDP4885384.1 peptide deformylase [Flavobacteriaceae bacterium]
MILPIVAYGDPVLRQKCIDITPDYPALDALIENMFATMYHASGVGLAAPQVGLNIRLFVVDTQAFSQDEELSAEEQSELAAFKKVLINPVLIEEDGEPWSFNEGCLSIPDIHEEVSRKPNIVLRYQDAQFAIHEQPFTGLIARVIQHEYDHIEGVLFIDKLSPLKKRLLKRKLTDITQGKASPSYRMKFPSLKSKK